MLTRRDFVELAKDQSELLLKAVSGVLDDAEDSVKYKGYVDLEIPSPNGTFCTARGLGAWLNGVEFLMSFCHGQNANFDTGRFMMYIIDYFIGADFNPTLELGKYYNHDVNYLKGEVLYINDSQRCEMDIHKLREGIEMVMIGRGVKLDR